MELIKGKYLIICKHLNGRTEIFDTDEYWLADNDTSIKFIPLNNPPLDTKTKKPIPVTLPKLLCKIEGGDVQ